MVTDVIRLLRLVTRLLDAEGIRYAIGGSLASSQYGELRATNDIDVMVQLTPEAVPSFVEVFRPHFDIWEDSVQSAVDAGRSFGALHIEWHVKVDFFPAGTSEHDLDALSRRQAVRLASEPDRDVFFLSAEDIVLRKLMWYRKSGGMLERQLRDVVGVLKLQATSIDLAYLQASAAALDLTGLLDQCLDDV